MIFAYLRERLPVWFFGPLALGLAAGALGRAESLSQLALTTGFAFLLLAQFRIWDDLADRHADAIAHPARVVVRASSNVPLAAVGAGLFWVNVYVATQSDAAFVSLLLLGGLHVAVGAFYLLRRGRSVLGDQLLLAKYPVFVCALAGNRLLESPSPVALAAAFVYAAASAYEAWHDPVSPLAQFLGGRS